MFNGAGRVSQERLRALPAKKERLRNGGLPDGARAQTGQKRKTQWNGKKKRTASFARNIGGGKDVGGILLWKGFVVIRKKRQKRGKHSHTATTAIIPLPT